MEVGVVLSLQQLQEVSDEESYTLVLGWNMTAHRALYAPFDTPQRIA